MPDTAGIWHPDPYGRAELRWYDGTTWTTHVSTRGVAGQAPAEALPPSYLPPPRQNPYARVTAPVTPGRSRLVAAGVLSIITGIFSMIAGAYLITVLSTDIGQLVNVVSGGLGTALALIFVAFATVYLWFGIAAVRGRAWSRVALIVVSGLAELMLLLSLFSDGDDGSSLVPMAWFGAILGLAISYDPEARPTH